MNRASRLRSGEDGATFVTKRGKKRTNPALRHSQSGKLGATRSSKKCIHEERKGEREAERGSSATTNVKVFPFPALTFFFCSPLALSLSFVLPLLLSNPFAIPPLCRPKRSIFGFWNQIRPKRNMISENILIIECENERLRESIGGEGEESWSSQRRKIPLALCAAPLTSLEKSRELPAEASPPFTPFTDVSHSFPPSSRRNGR